MDKTIAKNSVPEYLIYGFAISTIGGPAALIAINLIGAAGSSLQSLILQSVLAALIFLCPLMVWYRYSKKVASSGGLYSFVKSAAGEKVAKIQGYVFMISYFLYLPYTVTFIVYYLLPVIFPGSMAYAPFLEIIIPMAIVAIILSGIRKSLVFLSSSSILQISLLIILMVVLFWKVNISTVSVLAPSSSAVSLFRGGGSIALFFICASLTPFLGGEAKGGGKTIRKALVYSFAVVAVLLILISIPISAVPNSIIANSAKSNLPGFGVFSYYTNSWFAALVGIFAMVSTASLIFTEFIALSRLTYVMIKPDLKKILLVISVLFILFDAISLVNPDAFYYYLIIPSLVALYLSQLIVFLVYPLFAKKNWKISLSDITIAIVASALMVYGLYTALAGVLF